MNDNSIINETLISRDNLELYKNETDKKIRNHVENKISENIDDTLTKSGFSADSAVVGEKIDEINGSISTLSNEINQNKSEINQNKTDISTAKTDIQNLQNQDSVLSSRIDNFSTLAEGSTTGDAELADIRVGIDGTIYANAGTAVRTQVSELKEDLSELPFVKKAIYGQGLLNSACTGLESTTSAYHTKYTKKFPVSVGDIYAYKGYGNYGHASVAWFNFDGTKISSQEYQSKTKFTEITVPVGAYYAMFASYSDLDMPLIFEVYRKTGDYIGTPKEIDAIRSDIIEIHGDINELNDEINSVNARIDEHIIYYKSSYDFTVSARTLINAVTKRVTNYNNDNYTTVTFDVTDISSLYITASANFGNFVYVVYNANDEVIYGLKSANTSAATIKQDFLLELPEGATTLIVANVKSASSPQAIELYKLQAGCEANGLSETLQESISEEISDKVDAKTTKKWNGKKWVCLGDSLTENNSKTTKHYFDYVSESTGISVVNKGVSGTGYMRRYDENLAFYQRATVIPTDSDVVTIFGSGNDLSLISSLGEPTDTGTDTICGCINATIDVIIGLIPNVSLGIVSPTPWSNNKPTIDDSNPMAQYTEALRQICKIRSIPFLDLYHCSNLRPWTAEGRAACYSKDDGDGVHPDETGHKLIAPRFKAFVEQLLM